MAKANGIALVLSFNIYGAPYRPTGCELTKPGETVQVGQVTIVAPLNVPSLLGEHASELYAKNQLNLLELFVKDGALKLDWSDEVLAKTVLTHGGEIKNEAAKKAVEG